MPNQKGGGGRRAKDDPDSTAPLGMLSPLRAFQDAAPQAKPPRRAVSPLRAPRRKLPLGRGAVLVIKGRAHIVAICDVSVTGAYLTTLAPVQIGELHTLKLMPTGRGEIRVPARVVRVAQAGEEAPHHPRGVAVEFTDVDAATQERLEAFVQGTLSRESRPRGGR